MKYYAKPLNKLIAELSKLPGIGGKTAQRLAFHILSLDDEEAKALADAITDINTEKFGFTREEQDAQRLPWQIMF